MSGITDFRPPPARSEQVSALITGPEDALSGSFPQLLVDLQIQAKSDVILTAPVPDAVTHAPIDHISLATPVENVSVVGGWNASGSARMTMNSTTSDPDDPLPSSAILRGSVITQYDRNGNVVSSGEEGTIMGATSRQEWFATHPTGSSPGGGNAVSSPLGGSLSLSAMAGRLRMSDAAMASLGAPMSASLLGGVSVPRMTVHIASTTSSPGRSSDAVYLRLRESGATSLAPQQWVLREIRNSMDNGIQSGGKPRVKTVQRIVLRKVTIRDAVQVASLASQVSGTSSATLPSNGLKHIFIVPDDPTDPWNPPPPDPPPSTPPTTPPVLPPTPQPPAPLADPAPVIFQHGFSSQADRWDAMRDTLRAHLQIDDRAYTLPTKDGLELSSNMLLADVRDQAGFASAVFVAHSAGGVISRRVAQLDPSRVAGIITIGTPHSGALIAERGVVTAALVGASVLGNYFFVSPCVTGFLSAGSDACATFASLAAVDAGFFFGAVGGAIINQGSNDLRTDSPFIDQLNRIPEGFRRVGITHRVPSHNALARYLGDRLGPNEWNDASGNAAVAKYERSVQQAKIGIIVSFVQLLAASEYDPYGSGYQMNGDCGALYSRFGNCGGYSDPFTVSQIQQTEYQLLVAQFQLSLGVYLSFTTANWFWNWGTTGNQSGDGFIAAASPKYPNVNYSAQLPLNVETDQSQRCYAYFVCYGVPLMSHGGETRNARSERVIRDQLVARFGVTERPGVLP